MNTKEGVRRLNIIVSEPLYAELTAIAGGCGESITQFVKQAIVREIELRKAGELEKSAEVLAESYQTDEELLAFTNLDNEDFF